MHTPPTAIRIAAVAATVLLAAPPVGGRTLFLAHYDGDTADADFAAGSPTASGAPGYAVAGITAVDEGRWGRALDLRAPDGGRCAYEALQNLDIRRGTVDFWYCFDEDRANMYHPLFGWYNPPGTHDDGAFALYTQDGLMTFDVYAPSSPAQAGYRVDVGKWHHAEINWDCSDGNGRSTYNVYIDGRLVVRKTGAKALKAPGGKLHVGIWGYAYGHFLHGRVDELRITDQIEHLANFAPPTAAHATPGSATGIRRGYEAARRDLDQLQRATQRLVDLPGAGAGEIATILGAVEARLRESTARMRALGDRLQQPADPGAVQIELDGVADTIKLMRCEVARTAGTLYATIPRLHNETVVQLACLRDETDGLQRARACVRDLLATDRAAALIVNCRSVVESATATLAAASRDFCDLFADAPGARTDPIAALQMFAAEADKARRLGAMLGPVTEAATRVGAMRSQVAGMLRQWRAAPAFKAMFPHDRPFDPPDVGPVAVEPDGALRRVIFGGAHGRTDTMSVLQFDTLRETGVDVKWTAPDRFDIARSPDTVAQWADYGIPLSDTVLLYAVGAAMYRPPWFAEVHGDSGAYYFRPEGIGGRGFDYRHPLPRRMIVTYLEEAARLNGREPYTFVYKGPWEAHPYHGTSVHVPGKRTVAFQEHGFSAVAVQAFRDYLKRKHGTIDAMNRAWRSTYGGFDEIQPPAPLIRAFVVTTDERGQDVYTMFLPNKRLPGAASTALTYAFERCRKDLYADYLADCYAAIKRGDPKHPLASSTSGGIMGEILINSLDDLQMPARCVDMWGKHPSGGYGWDDSPYMYGLNRYFNKTLVALEYYGWAQEVIGDGFWGTFKVADGTTTEGVIHAGRRDVWHELSWDRRMLLFYWTQKLVQMDNGISEHHSVLLRGWSGFIPAVKRRIARVNDILVNVPIVAPRIAVVHPGVSIINAYPTNGCARITRDIFDRLLARQYHFGVVPEAFILDGRDALDNYDVVILPYAQYFADGFDRMLAAWVAGGGTLIAAGPFGLYNPYGVPLEGGAAQVFEDLTFVYPPPDAYALSWAWEARRRGSAVADPYLMTAHGRGTVLMTLDGRAFARRGAAATEAHVGTEIGAAVTGADADGAAAAGSDDRARPLKRDDDRRLPPAVTALYGVLERATVRQAHVADGNVEMVLRRQVEGGPLYVSVLNWDYTEALATEVVVRGAYADISDLSIEGGFPVPATVGDGTTRFPLRLGPGEGVMLRLRQVAAGG